MVCLVLEALFGHLLAKEKTFHLHSSWNAVVQDQALLIPFTYPWDCPGSSIELVLTIPLPGLRKYRNLSQVTSPQILIHFSPNAN